jgi:hypothetical protein
MMGEYLCVGCGRPLLISAAQAAERRISIAEELAEPVDVSSGQIHIVCAHCRTGNIVEVNPAREQAPPARRPDPEEVELLRWAEQAVQNRIHSLQEGLKQMVTLASALLAGSAAFFVQMPTHPVVKGVSASLLMVSLGCALRGWLPKPTTIRTNDIQSIRNTQDRLEQTKRVWLTASSLFLLGAFFVLFGGLLVPPLNTEKQRQGASSNTRKRRRPRSQFWAPASGRGVGAAACPDCDAARWPRASSRGPRVQSRTAAGVGRRWALRGPCPGPECPCGEGALDYRKAYPSGLWSRVPVAADRRHW